MAREMRSSLLVVSTPSAPPGRIDVESLLKSEMGLPCEQVEWDRLDPSHAEGSDFRAMVLVATSDTTPSSLARLAPWRARIPMLAVISRDLPAELLAMAAGTVDDFVVWPGRPDELLHRLRRLLDTAPEIEASREMLMAKVGLAQLVGEDPAFVRVLERIPLLAKCEGPLLITGETGTGKELCARAVHHLSRRGHHPFLPVDCASIPDSLFENELFGHARGAFTDAREDKRGLAAVAEHGTLFLDEVDSLSPSAQAKLLRFIQERTYRPLGAARFVSADVVVTAASNRDLEQAVREGAFRSDLYFRLNVLRLDLPPLRDRPADIALLARHVLRSLGQRMCRRATLSGAALNRLVEHDWPGNVRELINVLQRALVFSRTPQILARDIVLPEPVDAEAPGRSSTGFTLRTPFRKARAAAIESFERAYVQAALRRHHGNISRAAMAARKERRAFGRLVKKYGIDRSCF